MRSVGRCPQCNQKGPKLLGEVLCFTCNRPAIPRPRTTSERYSLLILNSLRHESHWDFRSLALARRAVEPLDDDIAIER